MTPLPPPLGGDEQAPPAEVLNQTSAESTKTPSESAEHFG